VLDGALAAAWEGAAVVRGFSCIKLAMAKVYELLPVEGPFRIVALDFVKVELCDFLDSLDSTTVKWLFLDGTETEEQFGWWAVEGSEPEVIVSRDFCFGSLHFLDGIAEVLFDSTLADAEEVEQWALDANELARDLDFECLFVSYVLDGFDCIVGSTVDAVVTLMTVGLGRAGLVLTVDSVSVDVFGCWPDVDLLRVLASFGGPGTAASEEERADEEEGGGRRLEWNDECDEREDCDECEEWEDAEVQPDKWFGREEEEG
jgi:hypothetical protein